MSKRITAFLWAAIAVFAASAVRAGTITYDILPNPQPDVLDMGYTLNVSGTITISNSAGSPLGDFNSTNDGTISIASDLTMTSDPAGLSQGPISEAAQPLSDVLGAGDLLATPTGLSVEPSTNLDLIDGSGPYVQAEWGVSPFYYGAASPNSYPTPPNNMQFGNNDTSQYFVGGEWEIAAAPEPATLTLLGCGMLGLALAAYRRRNWLNSAVHRGGFAPKIPTRSVSEGELLAEAATSSLMLRVGVPETEL